MQGVKAKLFVKTDSKSKFFKPRPVPHALKVVIEQELDRLESMGVIAKRANDVIKIWGSRKIRTNKQIFLMRIMRNGGRFERFFER